MHKFDPMATNGTPLIELIRADVRMASVIDRFGIKFEHYNLPLTEACICSNVDTRFVMAIYKAFECENYFPKQELQSFPLRTIIEYLIKTHVYYLNQKLPKLEKLMDALIANYGNSELMLFKIKDFYTEYKRNLIAHIQKEEVYLFPYILKLINAADHVTMPHSLYLLLEKYSIAKFNADHDHADEELHELGRRIRNFSQVNTSRTQVALILEELRQFESDLAMHGRLEDEILMPCALEIEDAVKAKLQNLAINN